MYTCHPSTCTCSSLSQSLLLLFLCQSVLRCFSALTSFPFTPISFFLSLLLYLFIYFFFFLPIFYSSHPSFQFTNSFPSRHFRMQFHKKPNSQKPFFSPQNPIHFSAHPLTIIPICDEFASFLMALTLHAPNSFITLFILYFTLSPASSHHDFSIIDSDFESLYRDYTPPSPPQPPPLPHPPSLSCEQDLKGTGSLGTSCDLNSSLIFDRDVYIEGNGSLHILPGVNLSCPVLGCVILINVSKGFSLHSGAMISAGTVSVVSQNASLLDGSVINVTGLAGAPPSQTSGTPSGTQGSGGGHGGRGASCVSDNTKLPDDVWGGDAYSWSSLDKPWSYGSKGGTTSKEEKYGGEGGGRISFNITDSIQVSGDLLANGGDGGIKGGGGSGGSIYIQAHRM